MPQDIQGGLSRKARSCNDKFKSNQGHLSPLHQRMRHLPAKIASKTCAESGPRTWVKVMVDLVSKMTSTQSVMRIATSDTTSMEVTINGIGRKYDALSGVILAVQVGFISLSDYTGTTAKQWLVFIRRINNVDSDSQDLAKMISETFWYNAKLVVDYFDKLTHLHDASMVNHFSPTKSGGFGSDSDDAITGSTFAKAIYGVGG